jgi:DNA end-binding protein Ku
MAARGTASKSSGKPATKPTGRGPAKVADKNAENAAPAGGRGAKGRPLWSGSLSFGLITIPVTLAPAVRDDEGRVAFHLLDDRDMKRLKREMVNPDSGRIAGDGEIARGVEVEPGRWITVEDAELRAAAPERSTTIEIMDFVPLAQIDPLYYDRPYLVIPNGALKPYRLLLEVLREKDLAGIARFVMHAREHYVALRVLEDQLCLVTLRYSDQLREADELAPGVEPDARLVKEALRSIGKLKGPFDAGLLEDDYDERVLALIEELKREEAGEPAGKPKSSGPGRSKPAAAKPPRQSAAAAARTKLKVVAPKK